MIRIVAMALIFAGAITSIPTPGQLARIVSDRKTIEITARDKAAVPAEVATVKIGYQNEADTKDVAYAESTKASAKIIGALLNANISKAAIETDTITLERKEDMSDLRHVKPPRFAASQEWRIHVKASEAQKVVDLGVAAGANQVGDVDWSVVDPAVLEAKAYSAALHRSKTIAEATATQAGLQLGEILSITNSTSAATTPMMLSTEMVTVSAESMLRTTPLTLFPPSIERQAAVSVVFAIGK